MTLKVKEVAQLLDVSEKTIYRWINKGILPANQIQDQYRFNRAEILEWANSKKISVSPDIFSEPESKNTPIPSLTEALQAGSVNYRIVGADKWEVLKNMVNLIHLPEEVDREFLYHVLEAREKLSSTGIGDGIAIPHLRNPVVLHISKPMIHLFFLEHPVDFGAIDGKQVHALFMLISPTVRAHLQLISRLAYSLRIPEFHDVIQRQGLRNEIIDSIISVEQTINSKTNKSSK